MTRSLREAAERLLDAYDAAGPRDDVDAWIHDLREAFEAEEPDELAEAGPGRPTKLADDTHAVIVDRIRHGATIGDAAAHAGIDRRTLQRWLSRGRMAEDGDEAFVELLRAVEEAQADHRKATLESIAAGTMINGAPDWKAKAWILERMYPELFSKTITQRTVIVAEVHLIFEKMREHVEPEIYAQMIRAFALVEGVDVDGG